MKQRGFWREYETQSAEGYCGKCNVTVRDIFRHRTGEEHKRAMSGIPRVAPGGAASYNPRKEAAARAYWAMRHADEQYEP